MHLDRYKYYADASFFDFEFESEGPKGKIKKIARFLAIEKNVYNFGFGDLDEHTGEISDTIVTNNGDGFKVLATVASIILDFISIFINASIFIKGSTPVRTRWYQMNISAFWEDIHHTIEVFGYKNGEWDYFKRGHHYEAFLGRNKRLL